MVGRDGLEPPASSVQQIDLWPSHCFLGPTERFVNESCSRFDQGFRVQPVLLNYCTLRENGTDQWLHPPDDNRRKAALPSLRDERQLKVTKRAARNLAGFPDVSPSHVDKGADAPSCFAA